MASRTVLTPLAFLAVAAPIASVVTVAVAAIATTGLWSGTAFAQPGVGEVGTAQIHYTAKIKGDSVVLSTDVGSRAVNGKHLDIPVTTGSTVAIVPLV